MSFIIEPSFLFLKQVDELSDEAAELIHKKLMLAKINPYRFKRVKGFNLFLFRIRFQDNKKEKRLIYFVNRPFIKVLCILNRDKNYKDLKQYLEKLGY